MQALDTAAIEKYGIHGLILMENAGRGSAEFIMSEYANECSAGAAVLCGPGNNGGDGFVIARHLFQHGINTTIFALAPMEKFKGDALINYKIAKKLDIPFFEILSEADAAALSDQLKKGFGLLIDALFGTGLSREVSGRFALAIEAANKSNLPIIAIDIPSGLSGLTGHVLGTAVRAAATCTMAIPKTGLVTCPGFEYTGRLHVVEIGIPRQAIQESGLSSFLITKEYAASILPSRPPSGHKGTFGHLLVISGSRGKTGAAALCGHGAVRGGAGLVTVAIPEGSQPVLAEKLTEAMTIPIPQNEHGTLSQHAIPLIFENMARKKAIAVGPGAGLDEEAQEALTKIVLESEVPVVADADALTALAKNPAALQDSNAPVLLTPHPGEMARLLHCSTKEVQADRIKASCELATETGATVLLKGARTVIAAPDGRYAINPTGNPGMGTGGMGDVLTGIIGALLAQGCAPFEAACLGAYAHGLAGDQLATFKGPWGFIASELADWLPRVWKQLQQIHEKGS